MGGYSLSGQTDDKTGSNINNSKYYGSSGNVESNNMGLIVLGLGLILAAYILKGK